MAKGLSIKQGTIHGYPSHRLVGRSSAGEGHQGIWAEALCSKSSKIAKKVKRGLTDGPTNPPTNRST